MWKITKKKSSIYRTGEMHEDRYATYTLKHLDSGLSIDCTELELHDLKCFLEKMDHLRQQKEK